MPVKAELSQQWKIVRMPRFKMGHCAPKAAAVNAATGVCGACAPDFAPEIRSLQELGRACCLGFSSYQGAVMAQSFFINPHQAGRWCINFFPDAKLAVFPWRARCCSTWEQCLPPSQNRRQSAEQQHCSSPQTPFSSGLIWDLYLKKQFHSI